MSPRRAAALRDGGPGLRDHLIATAARLIGERGGAGLTVRAIAREARVADGVLYNHFEDKEELLALALRAHVAVVESGLEPPPPPGVGTLADGLAAHLRYGLGLHAGIVPALIGFRSQPRVLSRHADLTVGDERWRDRLTAHLRAERSLGRVRADADLDAAVALVVGVCHDAVLATLLRRDARPEPDVTALVATILRGLASADTVG